MHTSKLLQTSENQNSGSMSQKQAEAIAELKRFYPDLPKDLVIRGHLNLAYKMITVLPDNLTIHGDLDLRYCGEIENLPSNLTVHGNLFMETDYPVRFTGPIFIKGSLVDVDTDELPDNFSIGGDLFPSKNSTKLPQNLTVGGSLNLMNTDISELPAGLKVMGNLKIRDTGISILPEDLFIGGHFDMSDTTITSIPKTVHMGGGIDVGRSGIKVFPKHITVVNGDLDISNTKIRLLNNGMVIKGCFWGQNSHLIELPGEMDVWGSFNVDECGSLESFPAGVKVGQSIDLRDCPIDELPENLHVNGVMDIGQTSIRKLPEGLIVNRHLNISGSQITELPSFVNAGTLSIRLDNTHLKGLPENFAITGNLSIGTYEKNFKGQEWVLPANLKVGGNLCLKGSGIKELPEGVVIGGDFNLTETEIEYLPHDIKVGGVLMLGHKHWDIIRDFLRGKRSIEGTVKMPYRDYQTGNAGVLLQGEGIRERLSRVDEGGEDIVILAPPVKKQPANQDTGDSVKGTVTINELTEA